jgi:hypothetical protein
VLLTRLCVLAFIEHGTRQMRLGGANAHPTEEWTVPQARNLILNIGARFQTVSGLGTLVTCERTFRAPATQSVRAPVPGQMLPGVADSDYRYPSRQTSRLP